MNVLCSIVDQLCKSGDGDVCGVGNIGGYSNNVIGIGTVGC